MRSRRWIFKSVLANFLSFLLLQSQKSLRKLTRPSLSLVSLVATCCKSSKFINLIFYFFSGWYHGERLCDGTQGWFPANHTEEILNEHVRARNLRQRYRLLAASKHLIGGTLRLWLIIRENFRTLFKLFLKRKFECLCIFILHSCKYAQFFLRQYRESKVYFDMNNFLQFTVAVANNFLTLNCSVEEFRSRLLKPTRPKSDFEIESYSPEYFILILCDNVQRSLE